MAVSNSTDRFNGVVASKAIKVPCKVATSANITLSGTQTIDGVLCNSGDRVLVRAQTNAVENGIWIVQDTAWYRAADWDGNRDVTQGTLITAFDSAGNASQYIVETADPISIGNTAMSIILYSQGATVAVEAGTVANAAMRWDGVDTWRQAQRIQITAQGADFQIYNATLTQHMNVEYEATGINFTISDPTAYFSFASDVSIDGADFFVTGVAEIDRVIAGDPGTEGTGISVNGTNYTSALKVSDLGDTHLAEFILHRHSLSLPATIVAARAASADSSHAAVGNNSHLFLLSSVGWDGATYQRAAEISAFVDGVPGASDMPGRLTFSTTPDGGFSPLERMRLGSGGTMYLQETATADADLAGKGQIFVRSDTPNVLVFRDDAGTEVVLGESNVIDGTAQGDMVSWDTVSGKYQPTNARVQTFDDGLRLYSDEAVAGLAGTSVGNRIEFWDSDKDSHYGYVGYGDKDNPESPTLALANYFLNSSVQLRRTNNSGTLQTVFSAGQFNVTIGGNSEDIYFSPSGGIVFAVDASGYIQAFNSGLEVMRSTTQSGGGLQITQTYNNNTGTRERVLTEADLQAGYRMYMGWGFSNTSETDPGASLFRFDNANFSLVTKMFISATDEANWDNDVILGMQSAGDLIAISDHKGRDEYVVMKVTGAPTDNLGWWTIPIEYVKGVTGFTTPSTNDPFIVEFVATSGVDTLAAGTADDNVLRWDAGSGQWEESALFKFVDLADLNYPQFQIAASAGNNSTAEAAIRIPDISNVSDLYIFATNATDGDQFYIRWDKSLSSGNEFAGFYMGATPTQVIGLYNNASQVRLLDNAYNFGAGRIDFIEGTGPPIQVAGRGTIYILNNTPNELWYQDDAGNQYQLSNIGAASQTISTLWAADLNGNLQAQNGGFITVASDGIFRIQESTTGPTAAAGYGYLWVKDDAAQKLYFRDDTGADFQIGGTGSPAPSSTSFYYNFDTTINGDPGSGGIRFTNASLSSVTSLTISETDADGLDMQTRFNAMANGSTIRFQNSDRTIWADFRFSSSTDFGTYRLWGVTYLQGSGTAVPANGDLCSWTIHADPIHPVATTDNSIWRNDLSGLAQGVTEVTAIRVKESSAGFTFHDGVTLLGEIYYVTGANLYLKNYHATNGTISLWSDTTVIASETGTTYATFNAGGLTLASGIDMTLSAAKFASSGSGGGYDVGSGAVFTKQSGSEFRLQEETTGPTAVAGYGYLWVKDDVAQKLYFRDDTGTDFELNAAAGTIGGTIADNQVAIGNGTDAIDGSASFTWDGTTLGLTGQLETVGTDPYWQIRESDAALDEKNWRFRAGAGNFFGSGFGDDDVLDFNWLQVLRSGSTCDEIDLQATKIDIIGDLEASFVIYIGERAAAKADNIGFGQLWVNSADSHLYFTNDSGTDYQVSGLTGTLSGLSDTNITSPSNGQVLMWDSTPGEWINTTTLPAAMTFSNLVTFSGSVSGQSVTATDDINVQDNAALSIGTGSGGTGDVRILWDGTDLEVTGSANYTWNFRDGVHLRMWDSADSVWFDAFVTSSTLTLTESGLTSVEWPAAGTLILDMNDNQIDKAILKDYAIESNTPTFSANAATFAYANGPAFNIDIETATGNVTFTLSGGPPSGDYGQITIRVVQDGTAARTITWAGGTFVWAGGTAHPLNSTLNGVSIYTFETWDGGTTWHGAGADYS